MLRLQLELVAELEINGWALIVFFQLTEGADQTLSNLILIILIIFYFLEGPSPELLRSHVSVFEVSWVDIGKCCI